MCQAEWHMPGVAEFGKILKVILTISYSYEHIRKVKLKVIAAITERSNILGSMAPYT